MSKALVLTALPLLLLLACGNGKRTPSLALSPTLTPVRAVTPSSTLAPAPSAPGQAAAVPTPATPASSTPGTEAVAAVPIQTPTVAPLPPSFSPTPGTEPTPAPGPQTHQITSADDMKTVGVGVGDYVMLALDEGYDWSNVQVSNAAVLQPAPGASLPAGVQALYLAGRPGSAVVSATGTVHCAPSVACPMIARLFKVTIVVD